MNRLIFKLINYFNCIRINQQINHLERNHQEMIQRKVRQELETIFFNNAVDSLASTCAWCQKLGGRSFTLHTENGDSKTLCSEVCFNQYRRASFKKNKV